MDSIVSKLRDEVNDGVNEEGNDAFEYATSKVFVLSSSRVVSGTIKCYKNGTLWSSSNYTIDGSTITVTGTLVVMDILIFTYSFYEKYSDTELEGRIRSSIVNLSVNKYGTFIVGTGNVIDPTPTNAEENLIVVVAKILMDGNILSYKTPDITITFADRMSKDQKIRSAIRQFSKAYGVMKYVDPTWSYEEYIGEADE